MWSVRHLEVIARSQRKRRLAWPRTEKGGTLQVYRTNTESLTRTSRPTLDSARIEYEEGRNVPKQNKLVDLEGGDG